MVNLNTPYLLEILNDHVHRPSLVSPTLAAGINVNDGGAAWTLGAFSADLIAAAAVPLQFDIHYISVELLSANDVYEIVLYYGAADTEYGRVRVTKNAAQDGTLNVPIQGPIIPAGSRVRYKMATATGGRNCTISVFYHTY